MKLGLTVTGMDRLPIGVVVKMVESITDGEFTMTVNSLGVRGVSYSFLPTNTRDTLPQDVESLSSWYSWSYNSAYNNLNGYLFQVAIQHLVDEGVPLGNVEIWQGVNSPVFLEDVGYGVYGPVASKDATKVR